MASTPSGRSLAGARDAVSKYDGPKQCVVNADCRLHGNANLFVAGSSVFPTYGTANSPLTILALAFRLSDHLRVLLKAPRA